MSWKPTFASGKLIKDYEPLKRYLELVRGSEWYDKGFLSNEDFDLLVRKAKSLSSGKLGELWDELTKELAKRINPEKALQALKETGYDVKDPEEARERMARILAGWLIEAGEEWGTIRFVDKKSA